MSLTPICRDAGGGSVYRVPIKYSALFDGSTDYLSRTPSVAGNRKTWTFHRHIKVIESASNKYMLWAGTDVSNFTYINNLASVGYIDVTQNIGGATNFAYRFELELVDTTGWGELVVSVDTTNEVAADRVKLWWNGISIAPTILTALAQNTDTFVNSTVAHYINAANGASANQDYVSDVYLIDGQALPASTWGEFSDLVTGLWVPKEPNLPYGYESTSYSNENGQGNRTGSIVISATAPGVENITTLIDGTDYGYNCDMETGANVAGLYFRFDFGTPKIIDEASWSTSSASDKGVWKWQGSNDATNWEDIGGSFTWFAAGVLTSLNGNTTPYRYYQQVGVSGTASNDWLYEITFKIADGTPYTYGPNGCHLDFADAANLGHDIAQAQSVEVFGPNTFTGGTPSASGYFGLGYEAYRAFDGVTTNSTGWVNTNADNSGILTYQLAAAKTLARYWIRGYKDGSGWTYAPKSWTFEGSNNGSDWDVLDTVSGFTGWVDAGNFFDIASPASYAYYRLNITDTYAGAGYQCAVAEIEGHESIGMTSPNDWTISGSPVQTVDTPTNNYATLNPFTAYTSYSSFSNGNLTVSDSAAGNAYSTLAFSGGQYVFEGTVDAATGAQFIGITTVDRETKAATGEFTGMYDSSNGGYFDGSSTAAYGDTYTVNDVIRVEVDVENNQIEFFKNNVSQGVKSSLGLTSVKAAFVFAVFSDNGGWTVELGAQGFTNTPTSGFLELNTANLPDPTVVKSASAAQVVTRVGTGDGITNLTEAGLGSGTSDRASVYSSTGIFNYTGTTLYDGWHNTQLASDYHRYTFTNPQVIDRVKIQNRSDGTTYTIRSCTFQGSHDGSVWDTLATISGRAVTAGLVTTHNVTNTTAYKYYQITNMVGNGSYTDLAYLQFGKYTETKIITPDMEGGPDFIAGKGRDYATNWIVSDVLRGADKHLLFNLTDAQYTASDMFLFPGDGYDVGTNYAVNSLNKNFLDLTLKADTLTELDASNNVVSRVSRGTAHGMEIIKFAGDGVLGRQITHNLGKAPTFVIVKCISNATNWTCYHVALGSGAYIYLNDTAAAVTGSGMWNSTLPTATTFTLSDSANVNNSGWSYIAYLFTDSDIFKTFSYTGNASTDGPFVSLGGKPLSIPFLKNTVQVTNWYNRDAARNPFNSIYKALRPNATSVEDVGGNYDVNFTSNGFKTVKTATGVNGSGNLHVGLAILESTKYTNAF